MRYIGITGGVGAGKSFILEHLETACNSTVVRSDEVAKDLYRPGHALSASLHALLPPDCFDREENINRARIAALLYQDSSLRKRMDDLVHPAVIREIGRLHDEAEKEGKDFFFLESALLIENGFDRICDELWYIYASETTRRERLKESRGYSDEKIDGIFRSQLPEEVFREKCDRIIDNDRPMEDVLREIDKILENHRGL